MASISQIEVTYNCPNHPHCEWINKQNKLQPLHTIKHLSPTFTNCFSQLREIVCDEHQERIEYKCSVEMKHCDLPAPNVRIIIQCLQCPSGTLDVLVHPSMCMAMAMTMHGGHEGHPLRIQIPSVGYDVTMNRNEITIHS